MTIKYELFDGRSKHRRWLKKNHQALKGATVLGVLTGLIIAGGIKQSQMLNPQPSELKIRQLETDKKNLLQDLEKYQKLISPQPLKTTKTTKVVSTLADDVETKVKTVFYEYPEMALAIFKAESGLNPKAKGYNCHYLVNGKTVSKACKKEDRHLAWSVDCGLTQINVKGQECPASLLDVETNLKHARAKFEGRKNTFLAWSAYKSGVYKKFL